MMISRLDACSSTPNMKNKGESTSKKQGIVNEETEYSENEELKYIQAEIPNIEVDA